jgi:hypothetical protein
MRIFVVSDYFNDLILFVYICPSGTFPKTHFTIGRKTPHGGGIADSTGAGLSNCRRTFDQVVGRGGYGYTPETQGRYLDKITPIVHIYVSLYLEIKICSPKVIVF